MSAPNWPKLGEYAAGVGFPAAVAVYLLIRLEGKIDGVTAALWAVERALARLGPTP